MSTNLAFNHLMSTNLTSTYVSSAIWGAEVTTVKKEIPSVASRLVEETKSNENIRLLTVKLILWFRECHSAMMMNNGKLLKEMLVRKVGVIQGCV